MTCFDKPPKATILFCEEVPPWDGDTQWAAMGHFAVNDYQGQRRVMHRVLLAGGKPVPAASVRDNHLFLSPKKDGNHRRPAHRRPL